jgi:hypothetical protein
MDVRKKFVWTAMVVAAGLATLFALRDTLFVAH